MDVLLRTTQQHHVHLSSMADQKANIIIAATSVLFTLSAGYLSSDRLLWGLVTLCGFSLVALAFAILSVTPLFRSAPDVDFFNGSFNPLFFGHFAELSRAQYYQMINEILREDHSVYEAIVRDVYNLGKLLKTRKYKYLRLSYQVFLAGILVSGPLIIIQLLLERL